MEKLTLLQVFNAMVLFLEDYYYKTDSGDVASLLSELQFLPDGGTADPAAWLDWIDAVGNKTALTAIEAFQAMIKFLKFYHANTSSSGVAVLLTGMQLLPAGGSKESDCWTLWNRCITDVQRSWYKSRILRLF